MLVFTILVVFTPLGVALATEKRPDGSFVVDCISTDGGGIPRNVIIAKGLSLVKLGGLNMAEFVGI